MILAIENLNTAIKDSKPQTNNKIAKYLLLIHKSIDLSKHRKDEYKKAKLTM